MVTYQRDKGEEEMKKCEICKCKKDLKIFIHTASKHISSWKICLECELSFLSQYYKLENDEVESFIDFFS